MLKVSMSGLFANGLYSKAKWLKIAYLGDKHLRAQNVEETSPMMVLFEFKRYTLI